MYVFCEDVQMAYVVFELEEELLQQQSSLKEKKAIARDQKLPRWNSFVHCCNAWKAEDAQAYDQPYCHT